MSVPIMAMMIAAALRPMPGSDPAGAPLGGKGDHLLDPGAQLGDTGLDGVDAGEHLAQQERVMAGDRLLQGRLLVRIQVRASRLAVIGLASGWFSRVLRLATVVRRRPGRYETARAYWQGVTPVTALKCRLRCDWS